MKTLSTRLALSFALGAAAAVPAIAHVLPTREAEIFPLARVRLLDGPFKHAQDTNRSYLLAHDIDRLLAPFRIEAGLPSPKPKYPNWESMGLDGHTAGHYLTALAQHWAAAGDMECKKRLDAMIAALAECQLAGGDGYVGGIPRGRTLWNDIAAGRIDYQNFSLNGAAFRVHTAPSSRPQRSRRRFRSPQSFAPAHGAPTTATAPSLIRSSTTSFPIPT